MCLNKIFRVLYLILVFSLPFVGQAEVKLSRLISNGMVLQRDVPLKIWGWANANEKVVVKFCGKTFETVANANGDWLIKLPATKAGGPYEMEVNSIKISNILMGDVWLCSGQSNMEYPMNRLTDRYANEIKNCTNTKIRQFKVPTKFDFTTPLNDYSSGTWDEVNPKTILNFSAVAYFFASELYAKYKVPVGIINATLGGSPAEAWVSAEGLKEFPQYLAEAEKYANNEFVTKLRKDEQKASSDWYASLNSSDKGLQQNWKDPALDDSAWPTLSVPGFWVDQGVKPVNGSVWFRRKIEVPESLAGKATRLLMGRIVDADSVFINGKFVGTTSYQYPQRSYQVPAGVLQEGQNTIVVRLISNSGLGGFVADKPYKLFAGNDTVKLTGKWHYQIGCVMEPTPAQTFVQWKPIGLFNGMMAPSLNYAIKGAAWYQGESNTSRFQEYQKLLTCLITDWRTKRAQGDFPFIVVQLPNFLEAKPEPGESDWAEMRLAQLKTAQTVSKIALTVNIDLGEWNDIHPQNKKDVGKRIALAAEQLACNEKIVASGPVFQSAKTIKNQIELSFNSCGSGLTTRDGKELKGFAIAGADQKYVWAKAEIKGNKILVWSEKVLTPAFVRYAWADNPAGANLINKEGLPASPFSTK